MLAADRIDQPRHELAGARGVGVHDADRAAARRWTDGGRSRSARARRVEAATEHPEPIEGGAVARHHHVGLGREPCGSTNSSQPREFLRPTGGRPRRARRERADRPACHARRGGAQGPASSPAHRRRGSRGTRSRRRGPPAGPRRPPEQVRSIGLLPRQRLPQETVDPLAVRQHVVFLEPELGRDLQPNLASELAPQVGRRGSQRRARAGAAPSLRRAPCSRPTRRAGPATPSRR